MASFSEPAPTRGVFTEIAPGIRRAVASNPGKMTYHGTNTYAIDTDEGVFVLDPGPANDKAHFRAVLSVLEDRPGGILVSHHHSDHFGMVPRLKAATGLDVYTFRLFADGAFRPDVPLDEGDRVAGLRTLHTPGHASDHLCFARDDGVLFTGDHVMTWSTSMIMLPDGDMGAYCAQLERLISDGYSLYLPGHGPPLAEPKAYTQSLLDHRLARERAILGRISETASTRRSLCKYIYGRTDWRTAWAAERNVEAHLEKLRREGRATVSKGKWSAVRPAPIHSLATTPPDE